MPRPQRSGRAKVFRLAGPIDILHKLGYELGALDQALRGADHFDRCAYIAINGAVTAWQMCDWVAADLREANRWDEVSDALGEQWQNKADVQHYARMHAPLESLVVCQQICTAFKHVDIDEPSFREDVVTFEGEAQYPLDRGVWALRVMTRNQVHDMRLVLLAAYDFWYDLLPKIGMHPAEPWWEPYEHNG